MVNLRYHSHSLCSLLCCFQPPPAPRKTKTSLVTESTTKCVAIHSQPEEESSVDKKRQFTNNLENELVTIGLAYNTYKRPRATLP